MEIMETMEVKGFEREMSLYLFCINNNANREQEINMLKEQESHKYNIIRDSWSWNNIMKAWDLIAIEQSKVIENEFDGTIHIDEMKISGVGATIKIIQWKNDKWNFWLSTNKFIKDSPDLSSASSLNEAIWKTITDFTIYWCEENFPQFKDVI